MRTSKPPELTARSPPAEQRLVDWIRQKTQALGERFCTGCSYCMPCPQEVNIPGIFRLWNLMRGYGNATNTASWNIQKIREQRHWADFPPAAPWEHCVECGTCEEKCPERLSIIDDLKRAHAELTAQ